MKKTTLEFIGFDYEISKKTGKDNLRRLRKLCRSVLFTAFLSALLIGLTLSTVFVGLSLFTIIFISIIWFFLVAYIDRAIVTSREGDNEILVWVRLAIIIGFVIIHSGSIDLVFFEGEIKNQIAINQQSVTDSIKAKYETKISNLHTKKDSLHLLNASLSNKIVTGLNVIREEIDNGNGSGRSGGFGTIAKHKYNIFKQDSLILTQSKASNITRIAEINEMINKLEDEQSKEINILTPDYANTGIIDRLSALHEVVFSKAEDGKSKLPVQLYYFAFLMIAITLESLPLICKNTYGDSVKEYHKMAFQNNNLTKSIERNRLLTVEHDDNENHQTVIVTNEINNRYKRDSVINEKIALGEYNKIQSLITRYTKVKEVEEWSKKHIKPQHKKRFKNNILDPQYNKILSGYDNENSENENFYQDEKVNTEA